MTTFRQAASSVNIRRFGRNASMTYRLNFTTEGLCSYLETMTGKTRTLYAARDPRTANHVYMYAGLMIQIPENRTVYLKDPSKATTNQQVALRMGATTAEKVFEEVDVSEVRGMAKYIACEFEKQREKILGKRK